MTQEYLAIVVVLTVGLAILMHEIRQQRDRLLAQERELHAHDVSLETAVDERTGELGHANEQLRKANRRR